MIDLGEPAAPNPEARNSVRLKSRTQQGRLLYSLVLVVWLLSILLFIAADMSDSNGSLFYGTQPVRHGIADFAKDIGLATLGSVVLFAILWPPSFDTDSAQSRARLQVTAALSGVGLVLGPFTAMAHDPRGGDRTGLALAISCLSSLLLLFLLIGFDVFPQKDATHTRTPEPQMVRPSKRKRWWLIGGALIGIAWAAGAILYVVQATKPASRCPWSGLAIGLQRAPLGLDWPTRPLAIDNATFWKTPEAYLAAAEGGGGTLPISNTAVSAGVLGVDVAFAPDQSESLAGVIELYSDPGSPVELYGSVVLYFYGDGTFVVDYTVPLALPFPVPTATPTITPYPTALRSTPAPSSAGASDPTRAVTTTMTLPRAQGDGCQRWIPGIPARVVGAGCIWGELDPGPDASATGRTHIDVSMAPEAIQLWIGGRETTRIQISGNRSWSIHVGAYCHEASGCDTRRVEFSNVTLREVCDWNQAFGMGAAVSQALGAFLSVSFMGAALVFGVLAFRLWSWPRALTVMALAMGLASVVGLGSTTLPDLVLNVCIYGWLASAVLFAVGSLELARRWSRRAFAVWAAFLLASIVLGYIALTMVVY